VGKPCQPMHPETDPDCPVCWRAANSRAHQRLWGIPETGGSGDARPAPRTVRRAPAAPCLHLGSPVRGPAAPDTLRDYRACDHPDKPLGAVVCRCKGCGKKCPGYEA
jgi:hypothetical protein